jgi:hypothetical protein
MAPEHSIPQIIIVYHSPFEQWLWESGVAYYTLLPGSLAIAGFLVWNVWRLRRRRR